MADYRRLYIKGLQMSGCGHTQNSAEEIEDKNFNINSVIKKIE